MGMFDSIYVYMICPYCKEFQNFECQTKDLTNSCYDYNALHEEWFTHPMERKFRVKLPVFPQFPFDREYTVWKNQAERTEAMAKVPKEFKKLKFVTVIADCNSTKCHKWAKERDVREQGFFSGFGRMFHGKIRIKNEMIIGKVYDIILSDNRQKDFRGNE